MLGFMAFGAGTEITWPLGANTAALGMMFCIVGGEGYVVSMVNEWIVMRTEMIEIWDIEEGFMFARFGMDAWMLRSIL